MEEIDDAKLKDEIDRIMANVDTILEKIQKIGPIESPEGTPLGEE